MRVLFIVPWFLFPKVTGGRIRTVDVLKGLRGRGHSIYLCSPAPLTWQDHQSDLDAICDAFTPLDPALEAAGSSLRRALSLASSTPVSVASMPKPAASSPLYDLLRQDFDVVVIDFVHTLRWVQLPTHRPACVFTHNVEAEIFRRQAERAPSVLWRTIWTRQAAKMHRFESEGLARAQSVVAVSKRDADMFENDFGLDGVCEIPTAIDTQALSFLAGDSPERRETEIAFTGSMDWTPNRDALDFLLKDIWPKVIQDAPDMTFTAVGKGETASLAQAARQRGAHWTYTGFVDSIVPYMHAAAIYVIPLRIGGGTRLKAVEAMALGTPIVSTQLGVEGLPVIDGTHYLRAETAEDFAAAIARLKAEPALRAQLSRNARDLVEETASVSAVGKAFEAALCVAQERFTACPSAA